MQAMTHTVAELLNKLHKNEVKLAFIAAGGGVGLFELFKIPGASKVLTEGRMLYSKESFESFLEKPISGPFVSQETANLLATRLDLSSEADICLAFTCALSTDRERKGENRGYLALCHKQQIIVRRLIEVEGENRADQDKYVTRKILKQIIHYLEKER